MRHVVPHGLAPDQARQVADRAFAHYRERFAKYAPRLFWRSETEAEASFRAKGLKVVAHIELEPAAIAVEMDVPFVLRVFQARAIAIVEREIRRWVDEATDEAEPASS